MNLVLEQEEESDASSEYMQNMQKCVRFYQYFYPNPSMEQLMDEFTNAAAAADMIVNTMEAQHKQVKPKGLYWRKRTETPNETKYWEYEWIKQIMQHVVDWSVRNRNAASE
eukprot:608623_1